MKKWRRGLASLLAAAMVTTSVAMVPAATAQAKSEGLGRLPTMGWCSWNLYQSNISESKIESQAQAMVDTGLKDKGYEYVIVDDGCLQSSRDANGKLQPQTNKFPNGFVPVSSYIHNLDLKFGMYNSAGTKTCAGFAGSYNHEYTDAQTFASWNIDFLKYDFCYNPLVKLPLEPISGESNGQSFTTTTMSGMAKEAPAIPKIVIKKMKDGVESTVKTVNVSTENVTLENGAEVDNGYNPPCMGMLDSSESLTKAGVATLHFDMDEIDETAKYTVDVYCVNADKTRWLSMQVNPETAMYSKFYIQSAQTSSWSSTNAAARSIYNVPLREGANEIQFYLDKSDIKDAYQQDSARSYLAMSSALDATDRDVVLNICDWGWAQPYAGWAKDLGHFWRTTTDITMWAGRAAWDGYKNSIMPIYEHNVTLDEYAGPYGYNDPDMLTVGLAGLNMEQNKSHFTLWCMMASPLLLGTDLTTASQDVLNIVGNEKVIALDQDELCLQAKRFKQDGQIDYLVKPLADGSVALCVFNKASSAKDASIAMSEVASAASAKATANGSGHLTAEQKAMFTSTFANAAQYSSEELWSNEKASVAAGDTIAVNVPAYGVKVYKFAPAASVSVEVSPKTADMEQGAQAQFTADVLNAGRNTDVTWTVEGATHAGENATRICELGWLTVAADEPAGTVLTVKATSDEDPTVFGTATVTVAAATKPSVVSVETPGTVKAVAGTAFAGLKLPETVRATLVQNGVSSTADLGVTWNAADYQPEAGMYTVTGTLDLADAYYNPEKVKASVEVQVEDAEQSAHTLKITFPANKVELSIDGQDTAIANKTGRFTGSVMGGEDVTLTFTPRNGRELSTVSINGEEQELTDADSFSYTFNMPNLDASVDVAITTVDKSILRQTIRTAEALQGGDEYNAVSEKLQDLFDKALLTAQQVDGRTGATQEEVDKEWSKLMTMIHFLSFAEGDPAKLEDLVKDVEMMHEEDYTTSTWDTLQKALEKAKEVLASEAHLEEELKNAYDALLDAVENMEYRANMVSLQFLVDEANALDLTKYVPKGQKAFTDALAAAKKLLKEGVDTATQADIDAAASELNAAMSALRLKPNKDVLKDLIDQAQQESNPSKALVRALNDALIVYNNENATQEQVDEVAEHLNKELKNPNQGGGSNGGSNSSGSGSKGGSYGSTGTAVVGAATAVQAQARVISDTTVDFTLKRGSAYCFKMTVANGNGVAPSFTVGNGSVLKTQFVAQIGNDYYFRVYAVGMPGQSTGVYTTLSGQQPVKHCAVAIG